MIISKYCADVENYESFRDFSYIYIYIYIYISIIIQLINFNKKVPKLFQILQ